MLRDLKYSLRLLSPRDQRVLILLAGFQFGLAILDLAAIGLLGAVTALSAASISDSSMAPSAQVFGRLDFAVGPDVFVFVAGVAGILLVGKSLLSFWGTRRVFRFLANRQAMIASRLANELLSRPLLQVQRRSSQQNSFALTVGVNAMTAGIIGQAMIIATEISLVAVLMIGLMVIDPLLTLYTAVFFAVVALSLHFLLARWAVRIGARENSANAASHAAIQESILSYREVAVSGRREVYARRFQDLVWQVARVQSDRMMVQSIGKYVFEIALIIGAGLLVLRELSSSSLAQAAAVIVVFFAAASRIMPSLLRLQTATLAFKMSVGTSQMSRELVGDLNASEATPRIPVSVLERMALESEGGYPTFRGDVTVDHINLTYPEASGPALSGVSLRISAGSSLALVGPTGAGKSTLADVILGVLEVDSGIVCIGHEVPSAAIRKWPGAIAYVPQETAITNGSIRDNVAMGLPQNLVDDDRIWEALERALLAPHLRAEREGLDTVVGEHGIKLSGGQRQRLGIARALYTRPRLVVMDEATSALDAETEAAVTDTFTSMSGEVTLIIIAHRLATIRHCDQVVYMDRGRVRAVGTFAEVRDAVPDFERQAQLLGL